MVMVRSQKIRASSIGGPGDQIDGVIYPEWMKHGLCVGADPEDYSLRGNWRTEAEIQQYIKVADSCYECPVMIKCGDEALANGDTTNTIRGGMIPPVLLTPGRGRPKGGAGLVKRGICVLGHPVRSDADTINPSTCRKCHEEYISHFSRARGNHHPDYVRECRNGHEYTEDNVRYSRRVSNQNHLRLERRCGTCIAIRQENYRMEKKAAKLAA